MCRVTWAIFISLIITANENDFRDLVETGDYILFIYAITNIYLTLNSSIRPSILKWN